MVEEEEKKEEGGPTCQFFYDTEICTFLNFSSI